MYPSLTEYTSTIKYLNRFALSPVLKSATPDFAKNGRPIMYPGGFSCVYSIKLNKKRYALRCWLREIGHAHKRYQAIKPYLSSKPLPYFAEVDFIDQGIAVKGVPYPVLRMEWVEGLTLSSFLDQNIQYPSLVAQVAEAFRQMVLSLHQNKISHGDLQDQNILVSLNASTVTLRLIDYDSLFVPALQGDPSTVTGLPTYQHPAHMDGTSVLFDERTDYFSELVIYLSLRALAEKPSLWRNKREQKLLFEANDFVNPAGSLVFKELGQFPTNVRDLAECLKEFCQEVNTARLLPLEEVLAGKRIVKGPQASQAPFSWPPPIPPLPSTPPANLPSGSWVFKPSGSSAQTPPPPSPPLPPTPSANLPSGSWVFKPSGSSTQTPPLSIPIKAQSHWVFTPQPVSRLRLIWEKLKKFLVFFSLFSGLVIAGCLILALVGYLLSVLSCAYRVLGIC